MKKYAVGFATLLFLMTGTSHAAQSSTQKEKAESQVLYKRHCAMCHGPDGKGNTPVGKMFKIPDLVSPTVQGKTDAQMAKIIESGKQKMPAFKAKLKPEQVKDLTAYIRELAKSGSTAHR